MNLMYNIKFKGLYNNNKYYYIKYNQPCIKKTFLRSSHKIHRYPTSLKKQIKKIKKRNMRLLDIVLMMDTIFKLMINIAYIVNNLDTYFI